MRVLILGGTGEARALAAKPPFLKERQELKELVKHGSQSN